MTTIYLLFDKDLNRWYLAYSITNRALDDFVKSQIIWPIMYNRDTRKVIIDINPARQNIVLDTAIAFADYFNVTLEL